MDWIRDLFTSNGFMAHGCCYMWNPWLIRLHVISDASIALAYYSIPLTLIYFVRRRKDLVFNWIYLCFAAFIVACGTTHLMEILNIWYPNYWLAGTIKAITAIISVITAILLVRLMPKALALPSPEQLRVSNRALQAEIEERKQGTIRIEKLNEELLLQTARLEAANKELETFAYSVSHDLRAPLRHIDGYVDILRDEVPAAGETAQRCMKVISSSAKNMGVLIDNLLAFSRMGRAAMNPSWINSSHLVEEVRTELAGESKGRDIAWEIGTLPSVYVDRTLFKQVWINLLSNAIKYSQYREKAKITVGCRENGNDYEFFVKDNGAGFDMQYADKLFGVFQRLHFKEEFEGTGIGLANVRRIITRHGGRTWAEGVLDGGATISFTIPRTASPEL